MIYLNAIAETDLYKCELEDLPVVGGTIQVPTLTARNVSMEQMIALRSALRDEFQEIQDQFRVYVEDQCM
ncbi:hypothetical protein P3L10_021692 [Capsicum annuum]